jgi:hypothetical protein
MVKEAGIYIFIIRPLRVKVGHDRSLSQVGLPTSWCEDVSRKIETGIWLHLDVMTVFTHNRLAEEILLKRK